MLLVVACIVMVVAGVVQRLTGLGFALVATPLMVLLYGPVDGVLVIVVTGAVAAIVMLATMLGEVDWRRSLLLAAAGAAASPLAAWVVHVSPPQALLLIVGSAGLLSLLGGRLVSIARMLMGTRGALLAGSASGFLHVASGLSGPPLVAYGFNDRWEQRSFAASLQVVFLVYHLITIAWRGLPRIEAGELGWLVGLSILGTLAGVLLARIVPSRWARLGMLGIAWAGTIAVLVRGALAFLE